MELETSAYNWQQGARAHWLDDELFIFNDFDDERKCYIARVFSCHSLQEVAIFDLPVQESFATEFFLAINYRRLAVLSPDYGYRNLPPLTKAELLDLSSDGIWRVDFSTGDYTLLYSLARVVAVEWVEDFSNGVHTVNHLMMSPSGNEFVFVHRYYLAGRRMDRLMIANADGNQLSVLANFGMVSHCSWLDDATILGYMRGPENKDAYWIVDVRSGSFQEFDVTGLSRYGDGHPHAVGGLFVTDTYPDKARMQHLILVDWQTGKIEELGRFHHGFRFDGETRCDLHPRMSTDARTVFFDSVFSGERALYKINLTVAERLD